MEHFAGLVAAGIAVLAMESVHQEQIMGRALAAGGWMVCSIVVPMGMLWIGALAALAGTAALLAAKAGEREWKRKLAKGKV
jgi:choline-glycine betaine transporter